MAIGPKLVKELRERTGAGMMDCKKALQATDGDIELAIENMRKSGAAKAAKKAGRVAAEGVIVGRVEGSKGMLLEVNSETDFVARDEGFLGFVNTVADAAMAAGADTAEAISALQIEGGSVEEVRAALVAKIGENIGVRRAVFLDAGEGNIASYLHGARIGVLATVSGGRADLPKDVAMHVAASNPSVIDPSEVSSEVVEKEKEIIKAQPDMEGKPENIVEKMMVGRINKFLNEISLTGQPFVKDPSITVGKLLKAESATVTGFLRLEVGEGIEKAEEDFAAEVAAQVAGAK
ncbi:translation elongation factor Ts [Pelagibaculum spongiae]|uniref:Elongation factor Ts n=1 Tax=Pelagibaculum spongiae TaxID=2080658 RepID=A0A2V1GPW0_9GAMM|nr:translation elongation factor Ts [Pelagibaculum spongiae]PVZ64999.1 elongation factor Ts [Pelagibaculum spongiae]